MKSKSPLKEILAIIPARGGSERVPRKNVLPFAGKPLIEWTIEDALSANRVSRTIVSTDDAEISAISRSAGAEVVDRPAELSLATSSSESALVHVLEDLWTREHYQPELIVFLQATSPLRRSNDIDRAVEQLLEEEADSLLSVNSIPGPGFLWHRKERYSTPFNFDPQNRPRTQEFAEEYFAENGSIYVFRREILEEFGCRLGGRITVFHQPLEYGFEIDNPSDMKIMQTLAKQVDRTDG
ncbi:MAG: acylneuraminate cytidylyltransferase family protein [Rhodospirillales bacterium]|jgi:CMP-N,N'-diacetyllegionaminic acid synthase|nr:acylneuraminate cytidylyltransferase family protein [Rhodospirillales bacterium]